MQIGPEDQPIEVVRLPSYRPNLDLHCLTVAGLTNRLAALLEIARARGGTPGIAYVLTVDEAGIAADLLKSKGIAAAAYYGDMEADERQTVLAAWHARRISVVCATSALGMGIDRADVRWIAHVGMPDSLLRYVQEIGRAGRDGKPAYVIGIRDSDAQPIYEYFVHASSPAPADYRAVVDLLRTAPNKRTPIVERLDIPEGTVQRILDDLVRDELCEREGTPFEYTWTGGDHTGVPEGIEESIATRRRFLEETNRYVDGSRCRAVALARAMGDEPLPQACRRCDRCRKVEPLDLEQARKDARHHLAGFGPPIRPSKGHHEGGIALSRYGLGEIGEAVKNAKYGGGVLPATALDRAVHWARDLAKAKRGPPIEVVASIPSTTTRIVADFAASLAKRLGVPWVELVKTRDTQPQKSFRSRRRKQLNIQGAVALPPGAGPYAAALLVDDVLDSGESLKAAGRALRPAKVVPVVMARAKHQDDA